MDGVYRRAAHRDLRKAGRIELFLFVRIRGTEEPERPRLRRVYVQDLAEVEPMARGFLEGLGGGGVR